MNVEQGQLIDLEVYRRQRRIKYLAAIERDLTLFLKGFCHHHLNTDFASVYYGFQHEMIAQNRLAWDFQDVRELIIDAMREAYGELLWRMALAQPWFCPQYLSSEDLMERCFSGFILSTPYDDYSKDVIQ